MEAILEAIPSPIPLASIGVTATVIFVLYRFLVSRFRLLSRHGIKGPRPLPILGNYLSIRKDGHIPFLEKQIKKYGPVFGYYVGATPKVAIADVEIAKEIMVKEFENFRDRGNMGPPNLIPKAIGFSTGLVVATGETWRNGRHTLTPSFSAMKMKLMVPLLKRSSDVLMGRMKEFAESEKSVEVFSVYGAFTMETLIATAFGRYVAVQRGEADDITKAADAIFRATEESSAEAPDAVLATLSNFPWLEPQVLKTLRKSDAGKAAKLMHKTAVALIMARKESQQPPKVKDLLQLMIDATVDQNNGCPVTKKLTTEQIAGFSIDFLLAGYETTANTLSYTSYLLAMNTNVQEKLQAEIDEYFEEDPEASLYEAAQKLKYLDMVISETLRLYSPVPKVQRHCYKTVTIGDVTIPEGVDAVIPINAIHRMPQYWPDPLKFDPERFTPEAKASRPQLAHIPFGWGPRNCIGMRFALLETKIALIEILRKYSFARALETPANLQQSHGITSTPKGGVVVKIIPRG